MKHAALPIPWISQSLHWRYRLQRPILIAAALIAYNTAFAIGPQSPDETGPSFEAASVRPNKSGSDAQESRVTPGRLTVKNMVLRNIVKNAYGFREDIRLQGAPKWVDSERFDISATAPGDADKDQVNLMLRSLLADRFKLAVHRETQELPIYILVPAKNGPKVRELKATAYQPKAPSPDMQTIVVLGRSSGLATRLSVLLGRVVLDKTGLAGQYDLTLQIRRDDMPPSAAEDGGGLISAWTGPSLSAALEEQLGLKLESTKAPVEIVVVDHIERPTAN